MNLTKIFYCMLLSSNILISQTHFIDDYLIEISGDHLDDDFYDNTYYNAIEECNISWKVIESTIPSEWEFSFCFPNCYNPGIVSGTDVFPANSENYLNCHVYPNNTVGDGKISIEITTNEFIKDTVSWLASSTSNLNLNLFSSKFPDLIQIFDISGKKIDKAEKNKILILLYSNGRSKKIYYSGN